MELPVRSVVFKLSSGTVLLSPGSKLSRQHLSQAGEVTDIVAPSLLHCTGMMQAIQVFPKARVWGPLGAREAKPEIPWTHLLGKDAWVYEGELQSIPIGGIPGNQESVFFDVTGKALYVTDLFFNIQNPRGLGARLILGLFGTYRRFALSRFFLKLVKDRTAFEASLKKMLACDFKKVVVSHGEVLEPAREKVIEAILERGFKV